MRLTGKRRGQALVEMLFAAVVFCLLIFGGLELAHYTALKYSLGAGAWNAARHLAVNPWDEQGAWEIIAQAVDRNVLGGHSSEVQVTFYFSDPGSRGFGSTVTVEAQMPYHPVIPFVSLAPGTITVAHSMMVEAWP